MKQKISLWKIITCRSLQDTDSVTVEIGENLIFGSWQGEEIEWRVLDVKNGSVLLLSEYGLDVQQYNGTPASDIQWKDCTLRQWLNHDFYENAFSIEEKEKIQLSSSEGFPEYNSRVVGGDYQYLERETEDNVFLLTYTEVRYYFADPDGRANGSNKLRCCYPTEYAKSDPNLKTYKDACGWWLCTGFYDSTDQCKTMIVSDLGSISLEDKSESLEYVVRPAIWVKW